MSPRIELFYAFSVKMPKLSCYLQKLLKFQKNVTAFLNKSSKIRLTKLLKLYGRISCLIHFQRSFLSWIYFLHKNHYSLAFQLRSFLYAVNNAAVRLVYYNIIHHFCSSGYSCICRSHWWPFRPISSPWFLDRLLLF